MKKQIIIIAGLVSVIMTPRAPRKHSLRGWFWRGVAVARPSGGGLLVTRECVARARCALCVSSYLFGLHFV